VKDFSKKTFLNKNSELNATNNNKNNEENKNNNEYPLWKNIIESLCSNNTNNNQFYKTQENVLKSIHQNKLSKVIKNKNEQSILSSNVYLQIVESYKVNFTLSNKKDIQSDMSRHWSKWYRNPYFHLMIIEVEDQDQYKFYIRPKILNWIHYMNEKEYEYLICYVPKVNQSMGSEIMKKFSLFKVFDKMKSDFKVPNESKSRVIKLNLKKESKIKNNNNNNSNSAGSDLNNLDQSLQNQQEIDNNNNNPSVKELYQRIHEGILVEFSRRCLKYENEFKKAESNMNLPGWNFFQFFILKEGMALCLEQFQLFVSALGTYNQLLSFVNSEKEILKFNGYMNDQSLKIRNILNGSLYSTIHLNSKTGDINEFDFRCYLFSRQVEVSFFFFLILRILYYLIFI
jgi:hypothetical protein